MQIPSFFNFIRTLTSAPPSPSEPKSDPEVTLLQQEEYPLGAELRPFIALGGPF
jgi:hypothetical protein